MSIETEYVHEELSVIDPTQLKKRSLTGVVATAGSQGVRFVLQTVGQIVLARYIGPAQYGIVALVGPVLAFINVISDMGLGTAVVQEEGVTQAQISSLFWLNTLVSFVMSGILALLAPLLGAMYHEPRVVGVTLAMAALMFGSSFAVHPSAILTRRMQFGLRAIINSVQTAVSLGVGILAAVHGYDYWSLILMQVAGSVTNVVMVWAFARWLPSAPRIDPEVFGMLRFGASLTISNISTYFSTTADNILVGLVDGKQALGLYDKSYRLVLQPLGQLSAPVGVVAVPLLSRLQGDEIRYERTYRLLIQLPILICTPGLLFAIAMAKPLIAVTLGPTWMQIVPVFAWISFGGLSSTMYSSVFWLLTSQGRGKDLMRWSTITAAINVCSFLIGIWWGAVGVASVSAISFVFIQTPLFLRAATRVGPVRGAQVLASLGPIIPPTVVMAIALAAIHLGPTLSNWHEILFGAAISFPIYVLLLWLLPKSRSMLSDVQKLVASNFKSKAA